MCKHADQAGFSSDNADMPTVETHSENCENADDLSTFTALLFTLLARVLFEVMGWHRIAIHTIFLITVLAIVPTPAAAAAFRTGPPTYTPAAALLPLLKRSAASRRTTRPTRSTIVGTLPSMMASDASIKPTTPGSSSSADTTGSTCTRRSASNSNQLRIYLARHGQDLDNKNGILNGHRNQPLTDIGIQQAQTVAGKIKASNLRFDAIYASPLQRARRTAEIIADEGNCLVGGSSHVQKMDGLIERDFGIMAGTPTNEITDRCSPDILQTDTITYFLCPEGAETFPDLIERANGVVDAICRQHSPTSAASSASVLLVTHGDFGKMMYATYYNLGWEQVLQQFHFGNSEVLLLSKDSTPDQAHVFNIEQHNH